MYRSKNGSVHLSDGEVNLAILNASDPKEPGHAPGMYHFGFHVNDAEAVAQRIKEIHPEGAPKARPKGTSYAETRGSDPDGNCSISLLGDGVKNPCRKIRADRALEKTIAVVLFNVRPFNTSDSLFDIES
jgi:hypothetical protein